MRYGLNFGCPTIPETLRKVFSDRIRVEGQVMLLVGVCDDMAERQMMHIIATNGRRRLHWREAKGHFALYAG